MIINNIIVILTQLAPEEDMKVIGKIVLDAAEEAEHAFTEITFHDNDFDFFIDSFQEWDNYINKIRMNWNVVRPQV